MMGLKKWMQNNSALFTVLVSLKLSRIHGGKNNYGLRRPDKDCIYINIYIFLASKMTNASNIYSTNTKINYSTNQIYTEEKIICIRGKSVRKKFLDR